MRESLRRKRAARMAAVQALYSYAVSEPKPQAGALVAQLQTQWKESAAQDAEWPGEDLPEKTMLHDVVTGALARLAEIDATLSGIIKDNWRSERMDPVMLAILRCAVYELACKPERKTEVILDEYVTIAGGYFEGQELGYIHSALQQIAPEVRTGKA